METPTVRDYNGPHDLVRMQKAVGASWSIHSHWHIGDLAWSRHKSLDPDPSWPTRLWLNGDGDVVAWGWEEGRGELSYFVAPGFEGLTNDILSWYEDVAGDDPRSVAIMVSNQYGREALEANGYTLHVKAPYFEHCFVDLALSIPVASVPAGFTLRRVRDEDVEQRVLVHRRAWSELPFATGDSLSPSSSFTVEDYAALRSTWPYEADFDWVVVDPDGTFVATALGWIDRANNVGELEPVGVHPDFRRLGLGRAVSLAVLHSFQTAGITSGVVHPRGDVDYPVPKRLYWVLGFSPVDRTVTYVKAAPAVQ